jgi:hypothetical protein
MTCPARGRARPVATRRRRSTGDHGDDHQRTDHARSYLAGRRRGTIHSCRST